jgi:hypothetical protein
MGGNMATIRSIRQTRQLTIRVKPNIKLNELIRVLDRRFTIGGCKGCLSGLNRLVLEDPIAGRFR